MIKHVCVLAALAFFSVATAVYGQTPAAPGSFVIKNVTVNMPKTPEPSGSEVRRNTPGTWLEVETEFASTALLTPEIDFKYYILIAGQLLVGNVTHVNVPAGQSLFSSVYVAPRTLANLLKNQPLTATSVQNAAVEISRPGSPTPVAEKMLRPGPAFYRTMQQVPSLVLTKAETPFANYWWDRYEAAKPSTTR